MRSLLHKMGLPFLLVCSNLAMAQVRFSASISPSTIGRDEMAQLKLTVENAGEVQRIDPPSLKNFTIVSGPNQESGMSMVNGQVNRYIALTYIIRPKSTGSFIIPPAGAKADGAEYKSNAVTVKVVTNPTGNSPFTGNSANPFAGMDIFDDPAPRRISPDYILKKGEDPVQKINRNMFVRLEVDRRSCYVGEPVVATYKLYTRLKSESNLVKNPSFNGFSVIDLQQPDNTSYQVEKLNGRDYNVYIVRKVQLYPLLTGDLELGSAEVENNVRFIREEYARSRPDLFNDRMTEIPESMIPAEGMESQRLSLRNDPVTIKVKPLPESGKPVGFAGAVGHFTIETKVEKEQFSTDDGNRFAIIIGGEGNLPMVNALTVNWPEGIDGFDPKTTDDLFKGTVPVGGRRVFEFPFTASRPGIYTIPALHFHFFDPKQGKYQTVSSKPLQISVTKGTGKPIVPEEKRKEDSLLVQFFKNRLRVVSLVAVLVIGGLIFWLRKDVKKEKQARELMTAEAAETEEVPAEELLQPQQDPFADAAAYLYNSDGKRFYHTLNEALKHFVSRKLDIPAEELNKRTIAHKAGTMGYSLETSRGLAALIDAIEYQLYTPIEEEGRRKELYDKAQALAQELNTRPV